MCNVWRTHQKGLGLWGDHVGEQNTHLSPRKFVLTDVPVDVKEQHQALLRLARPAREDIHILFRHQGLTRCLRGNVTIFSLSVTDLATANRSARHMARTRFSAWCANILGHLSHVMCCKPSRTT